jgi:hypothetical protein
MSTFRSIAPIENRNICYSFLLPKIASTLGPRYPFLSQTPMGQTKTHPPNDSTTQHSHGQDYSKLQSLHTGFFILKSWPIPRMPRCWLLNISEIWNSKSIQDNNSCRLQIFFHLGCWTGVVIICGENLDQSRKPMSTNFAKTKDASQYHQFWVICPSEGVPIKWFFSSTPMLISWWVE